MVVRSWRTSLLLSSIRIVCWSIAQVTTPPLSNRSQPFLALPRPAAMLLGWPSFNINANEPPTNLENGIRRGSASVEAIKYGRPWFGKVFDQIVALF
jgi:hypothetical protein